MKIPIYRGLKLGTKNEYVEGFLKNCTDTGLDTFWIQDKDFIDYRIDIDTLSINFPNMRDSQGNKIFASLQKDGRGGDNVLYSDYKTIYTMVFDNLKGVYAKNISNEYDTGYKLNPKLKIIGIQQ